MLLENKQNQNKLWSTAGPSRCYLLISFDVRPQNHWFDKTQSQLRTGLFQISWIICLQVSDWLNNSVYVFKKELGFGAFRVDLVHLYLSISNSKEPFGASELKRESSKR